MLALEKRKLIYKFNYEIKQPFSISIWSILQWRIKAILASLKNCRLRLTAMQLLKLKIFYTQN